MRWCVCSWTSQWRKREKETYNKFFRIKRMRARRLDMCLFSNCIIAPEKQIIPLRIFRILQLWQSRPPKDTNLFCTYSRREEEEGKKERDKQVFEKLARECINTHYTYVFLFLFFFVGLSKEKNTGNNIINPPPQTFRLSVLSLSYTDNRRRAHVKCTVLYFYLSVAKLFAVARPHDAKSLSLTLAYT